MNISKIAACFNKACASYDGFCTVQNLACKALIAQLKEYAIQTKVIVDLGCGTGNSTLQIAQNLLPTKIFAADIADKMIIEARRKLRQYEASFLLADFDQPIFGNGSIELVFANMAFQWSQNLEQTLRVLNRQVTPNGILAFSMPIDKTFCELHESRRNEFYLESEVAEMLLRSNFKIISITSQVYSQSFNSTREALDSIKKTGANFVNKAMRPNISFSFPNIKSLTYHIGFFIARKNGS